MATFTPADKAELKTAVESHLTDQTAADATYRDISGWDMRLVTDMIKLFCRHDGVCSCGDLCDAYQSFNGNISAWDVSSVTNIDMFR